MSDDNLRRRMMEAEDEHGKLERRVEALELRRSEQPALSTDLAVLYGHMERSARKRAGVEAGQVEAMERALHAAISRENEALRLLNLAVLMLGNDMPLSLREEIKRLSQR